MPVVCDAGAQPDSPQPDSSKDSEDIFRKRLTSALVVPDEAKQSKLEPGLARRKPRVSDGFQVLDVSRLSLEQRVLVQLNGIGLISSSSSNVQVCGLGGRFAIVSFPWNSKDAKRGGLKFCISSVRPFSRPEFIGPGTELNIQTIPNRSARH